MNLSHSHKYDVKTLQPNCDILVISLYIWKNDVYGKKKKYCTNWIVNNKIKDTYKICYDFKLIN